MGYIINTDYLSIITESASPLSPVYKEAADNAEKGTNKGLAQLKNFITSIENLSKKPGVKDTRISSSKGNIKEFSGYEDIKHAIEFLNKNLSGVADVKECVTIYDALENWASLYERGYSDNIRLIQLEYENAVYMLATGLSTIISTNMDVVANGTEIKMVKKSASTHGIIQKTLKDLAKELGNRNHKEYLEALLKASGKNINESVYTEGVVEAVMATFELIKNLFTNGYSILSKGAMVLKTVKKSIFGIVPLIRCCMYIRYKKKADTIVALEEQMVFISRNIEQLKNMKNMDEVKKRMIIRKQEATIEAYRKKAEKLRAELMETEKDAAVAIKKEDPQMKDTDGDLVLESGRTIEEVFSERGGRNTKRSNLRGADINQYRMQQNMNSFLGGIFGKKKETTKEEPEQDSQLEKDIADAIEQFKKDNARKTVTLKLGPNSKDDPSKVTHTKIGGTPYWPEGEQWPMYDGRHMICVAQLNFSDLPKLEDFPTTGMLQFFIDSDEIWDSPDGVKVVYHGTIDPSKSLKDVPVTTEDDRAGFIDNEVFYPTGELEEDYPNCDNECCNILDYLNDKFGKDVIDKYIKFVWKHTNSSFGTRISGWPSYTQSEPRYVDKDTVQLLQMDSEGGMMWGDCGIAHFFIKKEDLKNKNFDHVMFTWDCC